MQISMAPRNVQTVGIQKSRKFTLKPGAHIMALLSGIYKNPKDAITREYLSNMLDAYVPLVKAGKVVKAPILRVPTKLNPVIEFQDFGIGMDFDTAWEVYAEYGNSTKNLDNDSVGGFGIGSKTAFCYNNGAAWNIITTKNGKTNYFQAFVGADGVPDLNHVGETEEGLPDGTTVSIPVRVQDVEEFQAAARTYIPYFPMELVVEGMQDVPKKPEYLFRGKDWGLRGKSSGTNVVMGNVPYELDLHAIPTFRSMIPDGMFQFVWYNGFDLFAPIGAVDIVPSRDDLQYTDKTLKYLVTAFKEAYTQIGPTITDRIKNAKTLWEAIVSRNYAVASISGLNNDSLKGIKWNGIDLGSSLSFDLTDLRKKLDVRDLTEYAIRNSDIATPEVDDKCSKIHLRVPDKNQKHTSVIILNDSNGKVAGTARGYIRDNFVAVDSWSKRVRRYGHTMCNVYVFSTNDSVDKIREALGGFDGPILKASDLTGKVSKVNGPKVGNIYRWNGRSSFDARVNIPTGAKVYHYVVLTKDTHSGRFFYGSSGYQRNGKVTDLLAAASMLNITVDALYGVRPDDVADLDPTWTNLEEQVCDAGIAFFKKQAAGIELYRANSKYYHDKTFQFFRNVVEKVPGVTAVDITKDVKELEKSAEARYSADQTLQRIRQGLVTKEWVDKFAKVENAKPTAPDLQLTDRIAALVKKYPVVHVMYEYAKKSYSVHHDEVVGAIKRVGV